MVWKDMLMFFAVALGGAVVCVLLIILVEKLLTLSASGNKQTAFRVHALNAIQRFYAVVFSGASILSFLGVYYLIDRFVTEGEFHVFWADHKDFLLLVLIVLSIIFNNFLDHVWVPLRKLSHEEKSSIRVVAMIYVILIFIYIKYIYENNNYDNFIMYFLGLMVGRFIYFDASFKDFWGVLKGAVKQIPVMIVGLGYMAFMCYIGFKWQYLLKSNGVLVSCFFAHLFMIMAIFVVHHSHFPLLFTKGSYREKKR